MKFSLKIVFLVVLLSVSSSAVAQNIYEAENAALRSQFDRISAAFAGAGIAVVK